MISRRSVHNGGKVVRPKHLPSLPPQETSFVLITFRGWVDSRATVRPGGLIQRKIPLTPSGIEPATFRLVAQCLYQLPNPNYKRMSYFISILWPLNYKYFTEMLILKLNTNSRTPVCRHSMISVVSYRLLGKVLWLLNGGCLIRDIFLFFITILELTKKCNSGRWLPLRTISSIICLFESSTCFEQILTHSQEDNCIEDEHRFSRNM